MDEQLNFVQLIAERRTSVGIEYMSYELPAGERMIGEWRLENGNRRFGHPVSFSTFHSPTSNLQFHDRPPRQLKSARARPLLDDDPAESGGTVSM